MPLLLAALLAQAAAPSPAPAPAPASKPDQLAALYDEICLQTFPDDGAVDDLMKRKGATALTPDEVKVTLRDDPSRGWMVPADDGVPALVFIEMPPYHACSVRGGIGSQPADSPVYTRAIRRFKATRPGFTPQQPYDATIDSIAVHATQEMRALPGGRETLMVFTQQIADPARRAQGETGTMLRYVRRVVAD